MPTFTSHYRQISADFFFPLLLCLSHTVTTHTHTHTCMHEYIHTYVCTHTQVLKKFQIIYTDYTLIKHTHTHTRTHPSQIIRIHESQITHTHASQMICMHATQVMRMHAQSRMPAACRVKITHWYVKAFPNCMCMHVIWPLVCQNGCSSSLRQNNWYIHISIEQHANFRNTHTYIHMLYAPSRCVQITAFMC